MTYGGGEVLKSSPQQSRLKTRQTKTNCWLQERKETKEELYEESKKEM